MEEFQFKNGFRLQSFDDQKSPKARGFVKDSLLILQTSELPIFSRLMYGEYFHRHDHVSCQALQAYAAECDLYDRTHRPVLRGLMAECAWKAETTIEEMKKHWRCIPNDKA